VLGPKNRKRQLSRRTARDASSSIGGRCPRSSRSLRSSRFRQVSGDPRMPRTLSTSHSLVCRRSSAPGPGQQTRRRCTLRPSVVPEPAAEVEANVPGPRSDATGAAQLGPARLPGPGAPWREQTHTPDRSNRLHPAQRGLSVLLRSTRTRHCSWRSRRTPSRAAPLRARCSARPCQFPGPPWEVTCRISRSGHLPAG